MLCAKWVCLALLSWSADAAQVLRPQSVVNAVLATSLESVDIRLNAQDGYVSMEKALGRFDLSVKSNLGYEYKEAEALAGLTNLVDKTLTAGLTLEKPTALGSVFSLNYSHQAQRSILNPVAQLAGRRETVTLDTVGLGWRQQLWANAFGVSDRLDLAVAAAKLRASDLQKQEATEDLVLTALRAFWDAYVAQTQLQDAVTARQQYKDLINVVQRRGRFGLDKGGEYAQVMADFTDSDINVKKASYAYLDKLKALEMLMQTPFNEDLRFDAGGDLLPALPKTAAVDTEGLRRVRIAQSALKNAQETRRATEWRRQPSLDLVASAASTGVDERAGAAYSEFVSGTRPTYFVGLEFSAPFDSAERRAAEAEARVAAERSGNSLERARSEAMKNLGLLERKLEQTFAVASASIEAEKYCSRTVREQETEYRQGRLALRDLLQTYRLYFDAQAKKVRAIGDYHVALNEMAAERDELVR